MMKVGKSRAASFIAGEACFLLAMMRRWSGVERGIGLE